MALKIYEKNVSERTEPTIEEIQSIIGTDKTIVIGNETSGRFFIELDDFEKIEISKQNEIRMLFQSKGFDEKTNLSSLVSDSQQTTILNTPVSGIEQQQSGSISPVEAPKQSTLRKIVKSMRLIK